MTAEQFATQAHAGQFRRDGVTPYIKHPKEVASFFEGMNPLLSDVAWLHDTIEDTQATYEEIKENFGDVVADAVSLLAKPKYQPYQEYIEVLFANNSLSFLLARRVKLADIISNLSDSPTERQKIKYKAALQIFFRYMP